MPFAVSDETCFGTCPSIMKRWHGARVDCLAEKAAEKPQKKKKLRISKSSERQHDEDDHHIETHASWRENHPVSLHVFSRRHSEGIRRRLSSVGPIVEIPTDISTHASCCCCCCCSCCSCCRRCCYYYFFFSFNRTYVPGFQKLQKERQAGATTNPVDHQPRNCRATDSN